MFSMLSMFSMPAMLFMLSMLFMVAMLFVRLRMLVLAMLVLAKRASVTPRRTIGGGLVLPSKEETSSGINALRQSQAEQGWLSKAELSSSCSADDVRVLARTEPRGREWESPPHT